ncbi:glycosyl hydrolase [Clostridium facile]|nr:glycosyl hydrolase [Clostridium facile]
MKGKRLSKALAVALGLSIMATSMASTVSAIDTTEEGAKTFAEKMNDRFQNPENEYKVETRWWLAEGSHTDETLRESIKELHDYGIGAVEFVTLDESAYLDDATYAWGSEEWIHDSHLIVEECNKYGMGVSFTSGTHWASANLTTINPDEEKASQELSYTTIDVSSGQKYDGKLILPELPGTATKADLVKVTVAKKASTDGKVTNLDQNSMQDITSMVAQQADGSYNIQYTAPQDGDYTVFAFWQHGTSETYKPASTGEAYTINYFSKEGANALIEYWNEHVLDESLKQLIKENGDVSLYMDSLELSPHGVNTTGNLWCSNYLEEFQNRRGYDLTPYLPLIITPGFAVHTEKNYIYNLEGNSDLCTSILNDVFQTNTELYMENCLDVLRDWCHEFGMTLRAEPAYGQMFDITQPIKSVDYVEAESWEFGCEPEKFRSQAGAAHLYDKTYSSETGALLSHNYTQSNNDWRQVYYTQFASGVQRTILHGYSSAYGPEQNVQWPGYEGMQTVFSDRFNKRQPNSIDYADLNQHLARTQKVLRQGVPQMDIGILRTDYYWNCLQCFQGFDYSQNVLRRHEGIYWQDMTLQDAGYTYDYFSPVLLQDQDITCENGLVQADGVGYQALIVYQEELPYESAQVLYEWAKNGLSVVIIDGPTQEQMRNSIVKTNESAAITTGFNDGKDKELASVMEQLKTLDTVAVVETQAEAYDALVGLGVHPRAEYTESNNNLMSVMRKDDDATYLYLYNYMYTENENYKGQVSVDGIYQPYVLDTWSGEVTEVGDFAYENGRTILNVDLAPGDIMVFALDPNDQAAKTVVSSTNVDKVVIEDGSPMMYVPSTGEASIAYSNGTSYTTSVTVPEDITLDTWNLTVQDWQPGEKVTRTEDRGLGYTTTEVTYDTNKVDINVGETELIPWKDIPSVGEKVSGVGTYTTSFTLPENWNTKNNGLIFQVDSMNGGTAAVTVNGQKVAVNMDNCTADISKAVQPGENTIEVRVTSSLRNRMIDVGYSGWMMGTPDIDNYGMEGTATLQTYSKVTATDKSILNSVITYAENAKASGEYDNAIESVQKSFDAALENAKTVANNAGATQEEVDAAWKTLLNEIHKLGFVAGDKTELASLIEAANEINAELDRYVEAGKAEFTAALEIAVAVYEDGDAMQAEINQVADNLLNAMLNLRFKADKSILKDVLAEAGKVDANAYTAESYAALQAAVAKAKDVYNNENANQEEVDAAVTSVQTAIDNLVAVDGTPAETPTEDIAQTGQESTTPKANAAKTGDFAPIAGLAVLVAGVTAIATTKRRK